MSKCAEPGELGFSEGVAAGFLLRVALGLLDNVGPGLDLVNALRDRFPGATQEQAGRWATWAHGARSAGDSILTADPTAPVNWDEIPVVQGPGLWQDDPMDRIRVDATVPFTRVDGTRDWTTVTVFGELDATNGQLLQTIVEIVQGRLSECEKLASQAGGTLNTANITASVVRQF